MYANLGFYLCLLALICVLYSIYSSTISIHFKKPLYYNFAIRSINFATFALLCSGFLFLVMSIFKDYSVDYIFRNSSNDLPAFYSITSFWSSLQGSHFLWSLIIAVICLIAIHTSSKSMSNYTSYLVIFLASVLVWMFFLLISYSDPFATRLPKADDGLGMNELLQNPYMIIHPPILFFGYSSLVVPYGYAMAALCTGYITKDWIKTMKLWSLIAWTALSLGIFLGGKWAYVELGWGGYWAWDPVENSSLIPWILVTALVHGLVVQNKVSNALAKTNILLAIFAFFFSFFGTFLTRSGVLNSVHSFAQSDIGGVYLIYLGLLLVSSLILFIIQSPKLIDKNSSLNNYSWNFSKELYLVCAVMIFVVFAAIVVIGTLYPIFSEVVWKVRLNVQAPYFNAFSPWIGISLAMIMGLSSISHYYQKKITIKPYKLLLMIVIGVFCSLVFGYFVDLAYSSRWRFALQFVGSVVVFVTIFLTFYEFNHQYKRSRKKLFIFVKTNLSLFSSALAHIGVMVAVLGFFANYQGIHDNINLVKNIPVEKFGYTFEYHGIDQIKDHNALLFLASVSISKNDEFIELVSPGRSKYSTKQELLHEVDVSSNIFRDIYLVLVDYSSNSQAGNYENITLGIYINPLIKLVWSSLWIILVAGIIGVISAVIDIKTTSRKIKII